MARARQIGWSDKSISLWRISNQLDKLLCAWCNFHIPQPTPSCECDTILTVGTDQLNYGYSKIIESFGELSIDCQKILLLTWNSDLSTLSIGLLSNNSCPSITIKINENDYVLLLQYYVEELNVTIYEIGDVTNPFPEVGETCTVKICNTTCTTT